MSSSRRGDKLNAAYFQCIGGASGDMILGALVDAGLSLDYLDEAIAEMEVEGVRLQDTHAVRGGVTGTYVRVVIDQEGAKPHRFDDFIAMVERSGLSDRVRQESIRIFSRMAEAESRVHRVESEHLHLHELGTLDTLVDVVGSVVGLEALGVDRVFSSPFPMGAGVFKSEHGMLPVPSPATTELFSMAGAPLIPAPGRATWTGEMVTPTGAAIITTLAEFRQPPLNVLAHGYGLGSRNPDEYPNVLGLWLGEVERSAPTGGLALIETNLDDTTGEVMGYVQELLFDAGARDVWFTPIQMKKNRPASMLSAIVLQRDERSAVDLVMRETTTLGVRVRPITRYEAGREIRSMSTSLGAADVKLKVLDGVAVAASPEFDDCRRIAAETGLALQSVLRIVQREAEDQLGLPKDPKDNDSLLC